MNYLYFVKNTLCFRKRKCNTKDTSQRLGRTQKMGDAQICADSGSGWFLDLCRLRKEGYVKLSRRKLEILHPSPTTKT